MVSAVLLIVVLSAVLSMLSVSERASARDRERAHAVSEARVGLDRMVRELRHAHQINAVTATAVDAQIVLAGQDTRVVYDCAGAHPSEASLRRCVRWTDSGGGLASTGAVIDRVVPPNGAVAPDPVVPPIFTPAYDGVNGAPPSHIRVTPTVPARGELARGDAQPPGIVLDDGFTPRNVGGFGA